MENFRIIYPHYADSAAHRVADVLRYNLPTVNFTSRKVADFPIVLRHRTTYSNGFVAWTPARMECYSMSAGESVEPTPWLTHLLSHELRHYSQLNALNWNALRIVGYVLGEQAIALGAAVTPRWFLEGDAIYYESSNGRIGRLHSALNYRTELLSRQRLSYDQYLNGSYQYFVPSHYEFGALLVEYGYAKYGALFWPEVLNYTTWNAYKIFPFYFALKQFADGATRPQLFQKALAHLEATTRESDTIPEVQQRGKYQSQLFPHYAPTTGKYYYLERSYDEWQTIYATEDLVSKARVRIAPIRSVKGSIRYSDTVAAWVQLKPNPFFHKEQEANIWLCNLATGGVRKFTEGTHALSPQPELALGVVRAIELTREGAYCLTERDLRTGDLLSQISAPVRGMELRELTRGKDGQHSLLRAVNDQGVFLVQYDWATGALDTILPPVKLDLAHLAADSVGVYFSASHNFVRRGFFLPWSEVHTPDPYLLQLALSPYGSEYIRPLDTSLLYSAYTINGYEVRCVPRRLRDTVSFSSLVPRLLFSQPERYAKTTTLEHTSVTSNVGKPYSYLRNALHWHSWGPFYINPNQDIETAVGVRPGVSAMSQNATSTLAVYGGYFINHGHGASLGVDWLGAWPRVSFALYTDRRTMRYLSYDGQHTERKQYYHGQLGLTFPYHWGEEMYNHSLSVSLIGSVNNQRAASYWSDGVYWHVTDYFTRSTLRAMLSYSLLELSPSQCLYPRWGFNVGVSGRTVLFPMSLFGNVYEVSAKGYLPGIGATHGVRLSLYGLVQQRKRYVQEFSLLSRGLWFDAPETLRRGTNLFKADLDYALPLCYPDLNLFSAIYLKRISAYLFLSYRRFETLGQYTEQTRVVGMEMMHDLHFLRTQYPCKLGYTVSYSPFGDPLGPQSRAQWSLQGTFRIGLSDLLKEREGFPTLY